MIEPGNLKIRDKEDGKFEIYDECNENQLAVFLEFNPINSDIPIEDARKFAEHLIEYYNHNYVR